MARCTGHRAGSPLIAAIRSQEHTEGPGLVIMSAQSSRYAGWTRTLVAETSDAACYNFLYEIEIEIKNMMVGRALARAGFWRFLWK